jgi:hypothetical protein
MRLPGRAGRVTAVLEKACNSIGRLPSAIHDASRTSSHAVIESCVGTLDHQQASGLVRQEGTTLVIIANAILAVILHELAHVALASALRVRVYQVGMSWRGPFIRRDPGTTGQNLAITLAGPGINLVLAFLLHRINPGFALNNLVLGCCNLLPFPSSDGLRALSLLKTMRKRLAFPPHPEQASGQEELTTMSGDEWRDEAA